MDNLIQLVYVSCSKHPLSEKDLKNLLDEIRPKNKKQGITGLLLYNDELFIQVIEGEEQKINRLYESLGRDKRHTHIVKLLQDPIEKRSFPDWSMGCKKLSADESKELPDFSEFMNSDQIDMLLSKNSGKMIELIEKFVKYT